MNKISLSQRLLVAVLLSLIKLNETFPVKASDTSSLGLYVDLQLVDSTIQWFAKNEKKLIRLDEAKVRDVYNKFIASGRFSRKSQKEVNKAFFLAKDLQEKKQTDMITQLLLKRLKDLLFVNKRPFRYGK